MHKEGATDEPPESATFRRGVRRRSAHAILAAEKAHGKEGKGGEKGRKKEGKREEGRRDGKKKGPSEFEGP